MLFSDLIPESSGSEEDMKGGFWHSDGFSIPDVPFTPLNNCEPIMGYVLKSWTKKQVTTTSK